MPSQIGVEVQKARRRRNELRLLDPKFLGFTRSDGHRRAHAVLQNGEFRPNAVAIVCSGWDRLDGERRHESSDVCDRRLQVDPLLPHREAYGWAGSSRPRGYRTRRMVAKHTPVRAHFPIELRPAFPPFLREKRCLASECLELCGDISRTQL